MQLELKRSCSFILLILLLPGIRGGALASPGEGGPTIHWQEIAAAIDRHPALEVAASELDEAAGAVAASRQYPNPVLGVELGRSEAVEGPAEDQIWGLELTLPVLSLGAYRGDIAAAEAERDALVNQTAALRLEVIRQVKEAFWRVAHGQDRLEALERSAAEIDALIEVARLRVEMGEARPMELSRLEIERARVDVVLAEARETARVERELLNLWLGSALPADFRVEADLSGLVELPSIADAAARAVDRHPAMLAARERLRAASARLGAERWRRVPDVEIGGFYERELDVRNYGGVMEVSIPLWNWNSGAIAEARAAEAKAERRRNLEKVEIEAAVRQSHAAAVVALEAARRFRDVIRPKAAETAAALDRMYQIGEVDVMNLLDARRSLFDIESELLAANLEFQLAYLRLITLIGGESDE